MERAVLDEARQALARKSFSPCCETLVHRREPASAEGRESGLICGGSQTHVMWLLEPKEDFAKVKALCAALEADRTDCRLVVNGEGWRIQNVDADGAVDSAKFREFMGGGSWEYRESLFSPRRVAIFGGGHCGCAVAAVLRSLDFTLTVVERRADLYTFQQLPERERCVVADFSEGGALIRFPEKTCAIVMTSDFPSDVAALRGVLSQPFPFIGLMGAAPKLRKIREALAPVGFGDDAWARVTAPVGLVPTSDTPEEIAVSVAAQILLTGRTLDLW